jgi:outer membrane protein OmpA-like peptidoglycan-associated protein
MLMSFAVPQSFAAMEPLVPASTTYHILVIDYYQLANTFEKDAFKDQVNSYLSTYIERCADIIDDDVKLKKSKKETMKDINAIVLGALKFFDYQQLHDFDGFSDMVGDKLTAIEKIDFRHAKSMKGGALGSEKRSIQEFYLKQELDDLKLLINIELGMFSGNNLMVHSATDKTVVDDATKKELLAQYTGADRHAPLGPIRVKISDESMALLNFEDTSTLDPTPALLPPADQDLMQKVLSLLEQNTSKLDQMQLQIDQMRLEQIQLWQQQQDAKNLALQQQIDDLKALVTGGQIPVATPPSMSVSTGQILNFPEKVDLYFESGSTALDANAQLALNEIVDLLARQPQVKVIISGFADKTGQATNNLMISQKRAVGVKSFFTKSGLNESRFITKYHGDSQGEAKGNQRRVTIEFIQP